MIKTLRLLIIFFTLIYKPVYSNENISKLNGLYLDGILDKETYLKSLGNLGVDTNNEIFNNLFDLFKNKILDEKAYSISLSNLIVISSENNIDDKDNNFDSSDFPTSMTKKYNITNCKGNSDTCNQIKSEVLVFKFSDNKVQVTEEWLNELIKRELSFTSIANIKTFNKKNEFDIIVSVLHVKGLIINFVFGGYIEENDFHMDSFKVKVGGTEEASGNLTLIRNL